MTRRVIDATVLSAAAGSLVAATIATFAADRLVERSSDRRLRAATDVLAGEIDELRQEQDESLDEVLEDENGEIVTSGIRLAVYAEDRIIAGDPWVPAAAAGECSTSGPVGERIRACGRSYERWLLVAGQVNDAQGLRWQLALAGLIALLSATALAAIFGRRLALRAVAPLARLSRRLEESEPDDLVSASDPSAECAEVRQIEEALDALMRQVQLHLDRHKRFAADAAHELQTPLAALCVQLELLAGDGDSPDAAAALGRARGLAVLIERLLMLASPVADLRRGFEPVALDDVIRDVIDDLDPGDASRIELESDGEGLVRGDPMLLSSMVSNAIENALKFSAPHPVRVSLGEDGDGVRLEVSDRGPGLSTEARARAFDPFFRERADATPGHGLGLALVAHIAEVHAASARFAESPAGATLVVTIPALELTPSESA